MIGADMLRSTHTFFAPIFACISAQSFARTSIRETPSGRTLVSSLCDGIHRKVNVICFARTISKIGTIKSWLIHFLAALGPATYNLYRGSWSVTHSMVEYIWAMVKT